MKMPFPDRVTPTLLPQSALVKTSEVDKAEWNFHPLLGMIQRLRFKLILSLLPNRRVGRLLEIGYGSGVFLPELAKRCDELYGIDMHREAAAVSHNLSRHQVDAKLCCGSGVALPFGDRSFDCVVAVSCLEYMNPFARAAAEIARVLKPDGTLVFVTPGNSPILDLGHYLLTGCRAQEHYGRRRDALVPTLLDGLTVQQEITVPKIGSSLITLYRAMRVSPRSQAPSPAGACHV
ncbi:MAG: class I SAM-dependent methyltransferase [Nitrospira sp.]